MIERDKALRFVLTGSSASSAGRLACTATGSGAPSPTKYRQAKRPPSSSSSQRSPRGPSTGASRHTSPGASAPANGALSGVVAGRLGYATHFTLSFVLCLLAVALLWVLRPAQGEPTVASTTPSV